MSEQRSPINYKSLHLELQEALRADKLYNLQNQAKIRAMEQNVPTYEDFRQIVNGAHLRPLEAQDVKPNIKKSWNLVTGNNNLHSTSYTMSKMLNNRETSPRFFSRNNSPSENTMPATCE